MKRVHTCLLMVCLTACVLPAQADLWGSVKGLMGIGGSEPQPAAPAGQAETGPVTLDPAPPVASLDPAEFADLRVWPKKDMGALRKVVVGGFRVAFAVKAVASDSVRGSYLPGGIRKSGVKTRIDLTLEGVDLPRMQAVVDRAYQDFLAELGRTGAEVLPHEVFSGAAAYREIEFADGEGGKPYTVEHEGRTYIVLSPTGMRLWFVAAEPLGNQGVLSFNNRNRAGDFGYEHQALVLNPMLVVDFAETATGQHKMFASFRDATEAEAKAGMSLRNQVSSLLVIGRTAPISSAVMWGNASLKTPVLFGGRYGELRMGEMDSNRSLVVGLALVGLNAGPVVNKQSGVMKADPAHYEAYAANLAMSGGRMFAQLIGDLYR